MGGKNSSEDWQLFQNHGWGLLVMCMKALGMNPDHKDVIEEVLSLQSPIFH